MGTLTSIPVTAADLESRRALSDWRVLLDRLHASYRTGSMTAGLAFVERVVAAAEALGHHPDVDLRYGHVRFCLTTHSAGTLTEADAALAEQISRLAAEAALPAATEMLLETEVAIDALSIADVQPFWRAVMGYEPAGDGEEPGSELADPLGRGPRIWFQQMDSPRPQRNRVHIDVHVPADLAEDRVRAALSAGGRLVTDAHVPSFWVLADAEGNEACVCTWRAAG